MMPRISNLAGLQLRKTGMMGAEIWLNYIWDAELCGD